MVSTLLIATSGTGNASDVEALATLAAAGYDTSWQKASADITSADLTACTGLAVTYSASSTPLITLGVSTLARPVLTLNRGATWVQHLNIAAAGSQTNGVTQISVLADGAALLGVGEGFMPVLSSIGSIQFVTGVPASATRYAQRGTLATELTHFRIASGAAINNGATAPADRGYAVWFSDTDVVKVLQSARDFVAGVAGAVLGSPSLHQTAGAYLLDHNFTGPAGSVFTSDENYTHLAGSKPAVVRASFSKGLRFDGAGQSIVQHVYDPAPGAGVINHDRIYRLSAPVTATSEVWQARVGTARGPGYAFTSDNRLRLLKVTGVNGVSSGTTTATLPVGTPFRVAMTTNGSTVTVKLYANDTTTTPLETLTSPTSDNVAVTAVRDGVVTVTGLGAGVSLDVFYPQDARSLVPGPRTYVLPTDPPQALALQPLETEPWRKGVTLTGTAVQESNPIASQVWAPAGGNPVTLDAGSGPVRTFTAPASLDAQALDFTFTVTDTQGLTGSTTVTVPVLPATYAVRHAGQVVPLEQHVYDAATWENVAALPPLLGVIVVTDFQALAAQTTQQTWTFSTGTVTVDVVTEFRPWTAAEDGPWTTRSTTTQAGLHTVSVGSLTEQSEFEARLIMSAAGYETRIITYRTAGFEALRFTTATATPPPPPPEQPLRTAWLDPFDAQSFWKIGLPTSGAQFTDVPQLRAYGGWVNTGPYAQNVVLAKTTDPLATVTNSKFPDLPSFQCRIPADAPIPSGSDAHVAVVQPDGRTAFELYGTARISDTSYTVRRHAVVDLYGEGGGPDGGVRANGTAAMGGIIRRRDLEIGVIDHLVAVALRKEQLYFNRTLWESLGSPTGYYTSGVTDATLMPGHVEGKPRSGFMRGPGYVWPATEQDSDFATSYDPAGLIPMGAIFAIPPSVNVETIKMANGSTIPEEAKMLARACQDYGAMVADRAGDVAFITEGGSSGTPQKAWRDVMVGGSSFNRQPVNAVIAQLRLVSNSTEAAPLGAVKGAARRVPLAGGFA